MEHAQAACQRNAEVIAILISSGMAAEIYKAETRGMPIRYFTEEMEEIRHG